MPQSAAAPEHTGSNSHPSRTIPTVCLSRKEREVAHAEPCELRDLVGTDAEVAVRGLEQHHHHRHVPLLSRWEQSVTDTYDNGPVTTQLD
jgi:hypothetical protein